MSKAEPIILGLVDRDSRINEVIAMFRTLQSQYEVNLHIDDFLESPVIRIIAVFYYIIYTILSRRLREVTKLIKQTHI